MILLGSIAKEKTSFSSSTSRPRACPLASMLNSRTVPPFRSRTWNSILVINIWSLSSSSSLNSHLSNLGTQDPAIFTIPAEILAVCTQVNRTK